MGTLSWSLVGEGSKMKLVAAACLVAAVFAEPEAKADADAALLYGGYGYTGLGYAGFGYAGLGYAGYGYPYAGYGYGHYLGKRAADASPRLMLRLMLLFSMEAMGILVLDILVLDMLVLDIELMLDIPTPMGLMLDILMPMANKS